MCGHSSWYVTVDQELCLEVEQQCLYELFVDVPLDSKTPLQAAHSRTDPFISFMPNR